MSSDQELEQRTPTDEALPPRWAESHRFVPRAFVQPALWFLRREAASGIVMLVAAVLALLWANSPFGDGYFALFGATIEISFGGFHLQHLSELTVREWINDAGMVIFFFVVGLEIKREVVVGDLRDPRAASLPVLGALGGMVVPALIYVAFNAGGEASGGWGIPMATDIAFAVGVVSMVGQRVPVQAKLFLLALAIVDDLGAILVIAVFYTEELAFGWLGAAALGLVLVYSMRRVNIRSMSLYVIAGVFVWLAVLESGVHATIAGVALAFVTPVHSFYKPERFPARARSLIERIEEYLPEGRDLREAEHHTLERVQNSMEELNLLARESLPPLDRLEHSLAAWSSYLIVPVFAFANAGVRLTGDAISGVGTDPVFLGVAVGLFVGKVVGVTGFAWVGVKLGLGRLPRKTTWHHMIGVGFLAGIGFTVALFVSTLAFDPGAPFADTAKIGIFAASLVAGLIGFVWLRFVAADPEDLDKDRDGVLDHRQTPRTD